MAKTTVHGGASDATDPVSSPRIRRAVLGGEQKSVGMDSSVSSEKTSRESNKQTASPQDPAPTTESPLEADQETPSIAPSTDTSGLKETQQPSGRRAAKKTTKSRSNVDENEFEDIE